MAKPKISALVSLLLFLVVTAGVRAEKPLIVSFDLAHSEIFSPFAEKRLNYSIFYRMFEKAGFTLRLNKQPLTDKTLADVHSLVLFGPMRPLRNSELSVLDKFVEQGGNLLVLLHISSPAAQLTRRFNILVSNGILMDETNKIKEASDFFVPNISSHPLTKGVKKLAVFGSWGVMSLKDSRTIAKSSPATWMETNNNRKQDKSEKAGRFGIVAVNESHRGKVLVIADDAPLLNNFIHVADNRMFARNIVQWFKGQGN